MIRCVSKTKKPKGPKKPRDWLAVHVHHKTGAGSHCGSVKQNHKRDRKKPTQDLKPFKYKEYKGDE